MIGCLKGLMLTKPLKINFKFQLEVRNGCHDLTQKAINFNDVAIVSFKGSDYRIHFRQ